MSSRKKLLASASSTLIRVLGNAGLIFLAMYGMTVSLLELFKTFDYKYAMMFVLCFGGLVRTGYDMYLDIESVEKPVTRTLGMLVSNFTLRGVLMVIGIYLLLQILTSWKIPYPNNYGLLIDVVAIIIAIIYDMIKDFEQYHLAITQHVAAHHHAKTSAKASMFYSKYSRYWRFEEDANNKVLEESERVR